MTRESSGYEDERNGGQRRADDPVVAERARLGELDDGLHAQRVDLGHGPAAEVLRELGREDAVGAVREDRDAGADLLGADGFALGRAIGRQTIATHGEKTLRVTTIQKYRQMKVLLENSCGRVTGS